MQVQSKDLRRFRALATLYERALLRLSEAEAGESESKKEALDATNRLRSEEGEQTVCEGVTNGYLLRGL